MGRKSRSFYQNVAFFFQTNYRILDKTESITCIVNASSIVKVDFTFDDLSIVLMTSFKATTMGKILFLVPQHC